MNYCPTCRTYYWGNHQCLFNQITPTGVVTGYSYPYYSETKSKCDHCYCRKTEIFGKSHKVCCNCGNQQLIKVKKKKYGNIGD